MCMPQGYSQKMLKSGSKTNSYIRGSIHIHTEKTGKIQKKAKTPAAMSGFLGR